MYPTNVFQAVKTVATMMREFRWEKSDSLYGVSRRCTGLWRFRSRSAGVAAPTPKKKPTRVKGWLLGEWWSRGELNPRPSAIIEQIYMFSCLIWISPT